ncbi:pesticin C-terminus-like muramidase [Shewanella surugensis]|uniref:Pesticin C-terminus-like muramidase n=1 Tax=Shewanella surugensis TaxID=212020 RepID=A0ABT0L6C2_9GAMM|nr:pesticin C-terminus-like muramidase [Shewanella surugensis]MCL1123215.1 pesticin C-terminus-like muramidase [Shewanella surugensis]
MIDFIFIEALEGNSNTAYVPDPENSHSGVTIGCGFDLGARSCGELEQAFESTLANKIMPYAGLKRHQAQAALQVSPLTLCETEMTQVNEYAKQQAITRLESLWQSSNPFVPFEHLPSPCQTVIASVAFQYGNLLCRTPNFWRQVSAGDWFSALENLRDFGDKYPTRRHKEANLLEGWLIKGA